MSMAACRTAWMPAPLGLLRLLQRDELVAVRLLATPFRQHLRRLSSGGGGGRSRPAHGTLCAMPVGRVARKSAQELESASGSRFPFKNEFDVRRAHCAGRAAGTTPWWLHPSALALPLLSGLAGRTAWWTRAL